MTAQPITTITLYGVDVPLRLNLSAIREAQKANGGQPLDLGGGDIESILMMVHASHKVAARLQKTEPLSIDEIADLIDLQNIGQVTDALASMMPKVAPEVADASPLPSGLVAEVIEVST